MTILHRRTVLGAGFAAALWPLQGRAQEVASAVDLAGRQRMLSQRIAKAYAQAGAGVLAERSNVLLRESLEQFRQGQEQLRTLALLPDQRKLIAIVDGQWADVIKVCEKPQSKAQASELHSRVNAIERFSSQLTYLFSSAHTSRFGRIATTGAKLRMLSQRHGKAYMLRAWGVEVPNLPVEMAVAADEFSTALGVLHSSSENIASLQEVLSTVTVQWSELMALSEGTVTGSTLAAVAADNEALLVSLESLLNAVYALRSNAV